MRLFPNDLAAPTLAQMASFVGDWLEDRSDDCAALHCGRLASVCQQVLAKSDQLIDRNVDPDLWELAIQAYRDVSEYWYVIEVFGDQLLESPLKGVFVRSLDDAVLPAHSGQETAGRDAQFELFVAAIATRAGLIAEPTIDGGADWILRSPVKTWALEAKRLKSRSKVRTRIRKAAKQIQARKVGGVVAVDLSLEAQEGYLQSHVGLADEVLAEKWVARTRVLLDDLGKWVQGYDVGFVLMHACIVRPARRDGNGVDHEWSLVSFWDKVDVVRHGSPAWTHYSELWSLFETALPQI